MLIFKRRIRSCNSNEFKKPGGKKVLRTWRAAQENETIELAFDMVARSFCGLLVACFDKWKSRANQRQSTSEATTSAVNMAGIVHALNAIHSLCALSQETWILDGGVTEHISRFTASRPPLLLKNLWTFSGKKRRKLTNLEQRGGGRLKVPEMVSQARDAFQKKTSMNSSGLGNSSFGKNSNPLRIGDGQLSSESPLLYCNFHTC
ncbi:hypothetical protein Cgig2_005810 [Carnegiea gigantea]|uniref:Uncharacterized protein n=1 Tax=Carnegiea gigantea TaxID=171969 RepID=A0A9Q1QLM4_9CARY|nr:hypothetical protein Cgig2_005810 [Carnegiea gigantea]